MQQPYMINEGTMFSIVYIHEVIWTQYNSIHNHNVDVQWICSCLNCARLRH